MTSGVKVTCKADANHTQQGQVDDLTLLSGGMILVGHDDEEYAMIASKATMTRTILLVLSLLCIWSLAACKGKELADPGTATVAAAGVAEAPVPEPPKAPALAPVAAVVRPASAAPTVVAEPGCEQQCKTLGYCVRKSGECAVGAPDHCRQSEICSISGACSTKEKRGDDGSTFLTCTAVTDEDCKESKPCKEKGKCKALDGFCQSDADPVTQKHRSDKLTMLRDLAFKVTKECEATKAKTLRLFKQDGLPNPAAAWAGLEGLNRDLVGVVIEFRKGMLGNYDVIFKLLDGDKDLLGAGCYNAVKEGITKGKDGCMFNGAKQDTKWLTTVGDRECLPTAPLAPAPAASASPDEAVIAKFARENGFVAKYRSGCAAEGEASDSCRLLGVAMIIGDGGDPEIHRVGATLVKKCCDLGQFACCDSYRRSK